MYFLKEINVLFHGCSLFALRPRGLFCTTQALCRQYLCVFNKMSAIVGGNNATNIGVYIYELFRHLKTIFII